MFLRTNGLGRTQESIEFPFEGGCGGSIRKGDVFNGNPFIYFAKTMLHRVYFVYLEPLFFLFESISGGKWHQQVI